MEFECELTCKLCFSIAGSFILHLEEKTSGEIFFHVMTEVSDSEISRICNYGYLAGIDQGWGLSTIYFLFFSRAHSS